MIVEKIIITSLEVATSAALVMKLVIPMRNTRESVKFGRKRVFLVGTTNFIVITSSTSIMSINDIHVHVVIAQQSLMLLHQHLTIQQNTSGLSPTTSCMFFYFVRVYLSLTSTSAWAMFLHS